MLEKASDYIRNHNLIEGGDRILVGVSGGADSVCLLHLLYSLYQETEVKLFVVHVHHGIRHEEADRDQDFVRVLCDSLKIPFSAYQYNVLSLASKEGLSEEEAGRKVRYEAFVDASNRFMCNKVAVAHNKDDNAETLLLNLFRGSALKGLTGMKSIITMKTDVGNITVIRPLLSITREEIEAYIKEHNLSYQQDSTNLSNDYARNRIRNNILGYVKEQINTNAIEHITNAAGHIYEAYSFIEGCIDERYDAIVSIYGDSYEYNPLELIREDLVIRKGIIRKILGNLAGSLRNIEAKHVEDVLSLAEKQVGKMLNLPYGMIAIKEYDRVRLYISSDYDRQAFSHGVPSEAVDIIISGKTNLEQYGICIETEILEYEINATIPKNSCVKWFDYDKIENTLKLRTRNVGDYLQIDSQGGRKKLKDFFIDEKIPKNKRDRILLVADGSHILWIIGYGSRISERYKISDQTKKILAMVFIDSKEKDDDR